MQSGSVLVVLVLGCCSVRAAELNGIRPRASRSAYSVTSFTESIAVAADLLMPDQVRRAFGVDLECCIIVEVGVFPKTSASFELKQSDFLLRLRATRAITRPADAKAVAGLEQGHGVEAQLSGKLLPDVMVVKPVAGYLYFPVPGRSFADYAYELEYRGNNAWLTLPLQAGPRK